MPPRTGRSNWPATSRRTPGRSWRSSSWARRPSALGRTACTRPVGGRGLLSRVPGQLVINDLRTKVFNSVLRQDMSFFDRNKVGEIVSRLSTDALIVGYSVSTNLSEGARAVITCLGSGSLMVGLAAAKVPIPRFTPLPTFAKWSFSSFLSSWARSTCSDGSSASTQCRCRRRLRQRTR